MYKIYSKLGEYELPGSAFGREFDVIALHEANVFKSLWAHDQQSWQCLTTVNTTLTNGIIALSWFSKMTAW
jgi:hypothetical protein